MFIPMNSRFLDPYLLQTNPLWIVHIERKAGLVGVEPVVTERIALLDLVALDVCFHFLSQDVMGAGGQLQPSVVVT